MKKSSILSLTAALFASASVLADAGNTLVTFSTKGPDTYANGATVADGEWYALCWSTNSTFGGISSTCEAAVDGEKVFLTAPLAEGGRCPTVVFQLDSKVAPSSGNYFVCLLDTRDANGNPAQPNASNLPSVLNAVVNTEAKGSARAMANVTVTDQGLSIKGGEVAWAESDVSKIGQTKITSFVIAGDKAQIKVSGMVPSVRYNVFAGERPDAITADPVTLPASGVATGDDVTFIVDAEKGKFFKVDRQPIK